MSVSGLDEDSVIKIIGETFTHSISKTTLCSYSKFISTILEHDNTDIIKLSNEVVVEDAFNVFVKFLMMHKKPADHYIPPKPAKKELNEAFKNKTDLQFYLNLQSDIPLLLKVINLSNYLHCDILLKNCIYTLSSWIRKTDYNEIQKVLEN